MRHDPIATVLDMIGAAERAIAFSADLPETEFQADERTKWAVFSQIVIIGEAAARLPDGFRSAHPEVPWSAAIGMRHRLVHGYDAVEWARVWRTIDEDLPPLLDQLKALLPPDPSGAGER